MGRFFPVYIRRSDGKIDLVNKHKQKEKNEPTAEQSDRTPDANGICDYYREVDMEEQKHLDWRRKLGGMLARDLGYSDSERGFMLVAFPENYRLYEHVKRAADDSKGIKTIKNHAGGGNERQDAYLYGHPQGRKKRFRSPNDFYPHLLWLSTDEEGDPDNCTCKICCPEEIEEKAAPQIKKDLKQENKTAVKSEAPMKQAVVVIPRQTIPQDSKTTSKSASHASTSPATSRASSATPAIRNEDQRQDLSYGTFIFRQGELVWFSRGQAWGLGVIVHRAKSGSTSQYTVQPLSHPFSHPHQATLSGEHLLRPWLAWSVPSFTHPALNNIPGLTFETIDWSGMHTGKYGQGEMEVDGSILAAKSIDASITPFDPLTSTTSPGTAHNGLYLGAEKTWLGDILRLRTDDNLNIMVLAGITSKPNSTAFNSANRTVLLTGDVYTQTTIASTNPSSPLPPGTDSLPQRLKEDLRRRNAASIRAKGYATTYTLSRPNATIETKDIKGRWYEASLLAPLLIGQAEADAEMARGDATEIGRKMNARLDCGRGTASNIAGVPGDADSREMFRSDRAEAVGSAAPAGFRIVDAAGGGGAGQGQGQYQGYNGGNGGRGTPNGQAQQLQGQQGYNVPGGGYGVASQDGNAGLDEFMNLDG